MEPPQIVFLLNSFLARVVSALSLFGTKRGRSHSKTTPSFSSHLDGSHTPAAVAQLAVTLLPAFCHHLESASAFFQVLSTVGLHMEGMLREGNTVLLVIAHSAQMVFPVAVYSESYLVRLCVLSVPSPPTRSARVRKRKTMESRTCTS